MNKSQARVCMVGVVIGLGVGGCSGVQELGSAWPDNY